MPPMTVSPKSIESIGGAPFYIVPSATAKKWGRAINERLIKSEKRCCHFFGMRKKEQEEQLGVFGGPELSFFAFARRSLIHPSSQPGRPPIREYTQKTFLCKFLSSSIWLIRFIIIRKRLSVRRPPPPTDRSSGIVGRRRHPLSKNGRGTWLMSGKRK